MTVHRQVRSFVIKLRKRGYEPTDVRSHLVQVGARTITVADMPMPRAPVGSDLVAWWQADDKRADVGTFTFRDRLGRCLTFDEVFPTGTPLGAEDRRFIDFGAWKQAVALMGNRKEAQDGGVAGGSHRVDVEDVERPA